MSDAILAALTKLDPKNDEQWTADGLPAVKVVADLMNDQSVTRKLITDAAPNFTRQAALDAQPKGDQVSADQPPADANAADQVSADTADAPSESDEKRVYEEMLSDVEAAIVQAEEARLRAVKDIEELKAERDRLIEERNAKYPPMKEAEAIKHFINQQLQNRAARMGAAAQPSIAHKAPIDQRPRKTNPRPALKPQG